MLADKVMLFASAQKDRVPKGTLAVVTPPQESLPKPSNYDLNDLLWINAPARLVSQKQTLCLSQQKMRRLHSGCRLDPKSRGCERRVTGG
ncbi:MAG: hypothetical protein AMS15_04640 [Planctomycetes bacterium DG_23]|nr:MAG: hypothetical protein AMS15_04640 [Planctomycetes bacterium DG_23]